MADMLKHVRKYSAVMDRRSKLHAIDVLQAELKAHKAAFEELKEANDGGTLDHIIAVFARDIVELEEGLGLIVLEDK